MASHLSQAMDQMFQAVLERFLPNSPLPLPQVQDYVRRTKAQAQGKAQSQASATAPRTVTLYDILEISPKASPEVITAAWRSLSKRHHPDKEGGSEETIKYLNHAHDILSHPQKRKNYDQMIGIK